MQQWIKSVAAILVALGMGAGMAMAGSQQGTMIFHGLPLFAFCVILAFAINWIAFVPAFLLHTERFFDLTGSLTYLTVTAAGVWLSPVRDARSWIIMALVFIWAARLGTFLFRRMLKEGKDRRFDALKTHFLPYLTVWTLQGLWVSLTVAAALVAMTTTIKKPLGAFAIVGVLIWLTGFVMETVADAQKSKWRANPENIGKFIHVGLWSRSRHPNYFGEMILWIGMAVMAFPVLHAWQFISLISPVFVILLLTRISGIPMLEKRADEKWGGTDDYEAYKKHTPVLIPRLRKRSIKNHYIEHQK